MEQFSNKLQAQPTAKKQDVTTQIGIVGTSEKQVTERQYITTEVEQDTEVPQSTKEQQVTTEVPNSTSKQKVIEDYRNTSIYLAAKQGNLDAVNIL